MLQEEIAALKEALAILEDWQKWSRCAGEC